MRKITFSEGETYHIFNRGVDKRVVFENNADLDRFFLSISSFNSLKPIGSIFENSFSRRLGSSASKSEDNGQKLVNFIAYCVNPNHYHFILEQISERGIEKFMHKLGTGYTKYFNEKNKRAGSLFQGRFKAVHIDSNEYLLHLSAYVNLNDRVHKLGSSASKFIKSRSSWDEYTKGSGVGICEKSIILEQFESLEEYKKFAEESLQSIAEKKEEFSVLEDYLLE